MTSIDAKRIAPPLAVAIVAIAVGVAAAAMRASGTEGGEGVGVSDGAPKPPPASQPTGAGSGQDRDGTSRRAEREVVVPLGVSPAPAPPRPGETPPSPTPMQPSPEAILLVSGHTSGWITPCGCPGVRAGGVARRAGYGDLLRKTFPGVQVRYLDLGGFIGFGSKTQRIITDAVLASMDTIGYEAANVAIRDLGSTLEQSEYIRSKVKTPRFSANVAFHDTGELAFPPYVVLTVPRPGGGSVKPLRIGLIGLVSDERRLFAFGPEGRTLIALPLADSLARYLPEVRSKSDLVVVMSETPPDPYYSLLKRLEGIDLVVCGLGMEILVEPVRVRGIPIVAVGSQGKYLAELRVHRDGERFAIKTFVHWLDARFPEEPKLAAWTEGILDTINESSRAEVAQDTASPPSTLPFVGVDKCLACHEREVDIWKKSKHAHAFDTLVGLRRDYTVTCVMCHVTGYLSEKGGGFVNPRATPHLAHVQCEACHGPVDSHVEDPSQKPPKVAEDFCIVCHTGEQDPHFDREVRWKAIAH